MGLGMPFINQATVACTCLAVKVQLDYSNFSNVRWPCEFSLVHPKCINEQEE
jgi:hypothetical protein